jgi:hypothetical protein
MAAKQGRAMGEAYVRFALERPSRFRLMFGGQLKLRQHGALAEAARKTYEALVRAFRAQAGVADPEKAAAAAWSLVHGLAQLLLDGHFEPHGESFVAEVIGAVRFASAQRSA